MAETFVSQLEQDIKGPDFGSKQDVLRIWYNKEGDCVQFKTMPNVATKRKRIDGYLTLYVSIEDGKTIGFQLKDIRALIEEHGDAGIMDVQAGYTTEDKRLVSITATALILIALKKSTDFVNRISGYEDAIRTVPKEDSLEIPVAI